MGVTIYYCLFGQFPFNKEILSLTDEVEIKNRIATKNFTVEIDESSQMSPILKKMIVMDPKGRISLENLLHSHPFKIELRYFILVIQQFPIK